MTILQKDELAALNCLLGELRGMRDALETMHEGVEINETNRNCGNGTMALLYLMEKKIDEAENRVYALEYGKFCMDDPRYGMIKAAA